MSGAQVEVLQGTLDLMVLKTLETLGPLHGYGIAQRLQQTSQDALRLNQGTLYPALIRLEQHIREVLVQLRPGFRTAIATNRGKSLPLVLQTLGLDGSFDLTVSCYDVSRPKPHPECLQKILQHFRVRPDEALYIGDSEVDRLVADEAGVPLAAYKNAGLRARYHLQDHLELLQLLDKMQESGVI